MASNLIIAMSTLDNRGDGTGPGTQILVRLSLYTNIIQSKEVSSFTTLELFELDYKHPTILFQSDNSEFFNDILRKIENNVARAEIKEWFNGSSSNQK